MFHLCGLILQHGFQLLHHSFADCTEWRITDAHHSLEHEEDNQRTVTFTDEQHHYYWLIKG